MRRALVMLATAALLSGSVLSGWGCGSKSYEERLNRTLDNMKYQKRLDANLQPAPKKGEGKFEELAIFVRPPKNMVWSKEFQLTVLEPGKFDLAETFYDQSKQEFLHVLARVKKPTNTKKKAATPANQGDFNADVLAVVNSVYGSSLDATKVKEVEKKPPTMGVGNRFKEPVPLKVENKNVRIDLFGGKNDPYQVALIFEYPETEQQALVSKIDLCLESFAVGKRAQKSFAGTVGEEEGEAGAGGGVAF